MWTLPLRRPLGWVVVIASLGLGVLLVGTDSAEGERAAGQVAFLVGLSAISLNLGTLAALGPSLARLPKIARLGLEASVLGTWVLALQGLALGGPLVRAIELPWLRVLGLDLHLLLLGLLALRLCGSGGLRVAAFLASAWVLPTVFRWKTLAPALDPVGVLSDSLDRFPWALFLGGLALASLLMAAESPSRK